MPTPVIKMVNITKTFPGVYALDSVNFELGDEVHALVGENGAGKSTLIKILCGAYLPDSGKIFFHGNEVVMATPRDAINKGISTVYQELVLVPYMSVAENIFLGRRQSERGKGFVVNNKYVFQETVKALNNIGVKHIDPDNMVSNLGPADQQLVCIAKAFYSNTEVFILDEPTASISIAEIKQLFKVIKTLRERGCSLVYITHHLEEVFEIADRVTVMKDGKVVFVGSAADCDKNFIIKKMIGRDIKEMFPDRKKEKKGSELLTVKNLYSENVFENINFQLHSGEILGISGLVGSGRTEVARALFGADPFDSGEIYLDGKELAIRSPRDAIKKGIVLVSEDRKKLGIFPEMAVKINMTISSLELFAIARSYINERKESTFCKKAIENYNIRCTNEYQQIGNLSGGNQQKVILVRWMMRKSKVIIFDEPTRGIDVGGKFEIYQLINSLAMEGKAVIIISSEMPEVIGIADRILIMSKGRIVGELSHEEASEPKILQIIFEDMRMDAEQGLNH